MTDDRMSGMALIAGSLGMIITMSLHPTGHVAAAQMEPMIRMLIAVHALALACVLLQFLGSWGLARRLALPNRLSMIGLVAYTFALLAVMNAAVTDGLVTPGLLRQIFDSAASPPAVDAWRMIARYNFYLNQAYAQVFVVASSVAILLWSFSIWQRRKWPRGLTIYGCILALIALLALFSGRLRLDAHGFGFVIFCQAAWFVIAGALLWRHDGQVISALA